METPTPTAPEQVTELNAVEAPDNATIRRAETAAEQNNHEYVIKLLLPLAKKYPLVMELKAMLRKAALEQHKQSPKGKIGTGRKKRKEPSEKRRWKLKEGRKTGEDKPEIAKYPVKLLLLPDHIFTFLPYQVTFFLPTSDFSISKMSWFLSCTSIRKRHGC